MNYYWSLIIALLATAASAADFDEFKVKREAVYEFTEKPSVKLDGDKATISFASKAFCDVTVVIEGNEGRIVRHLASGVLGKNAPEPFQKNSLRQVIVWDGKDDQGVYVDDEDGCTVRVSLGLKPRFERSLFWTPRRRPSQDTPLFAAAPEGVYVFSGGKGIDSVILYDRDGEYVRTVYPFPAGKVEQVSGLKQRTFEHDGRRLPLKTNFFRSTMLTSGTSGLPDQHSMEGRAASAIAVQGSRLALAYLRMNRLATDGATGGLPLQGAPTTLKIKAGRKGSIKNVAPSSAAFSPDGKTLYLTGYHFGKVDTATQDLRRMADIRTLPVVMKLDYGSGELPVVFKGDVRESAAGEDNEHFNVPGGIDVDAKGRVYVADYLNDRVQIFASDGKFLKSIPTARPADVAIHRKTGDIVVFSYLIRNKAEKKSPEPSMTVFGSFERPDKKSAYRLGSLRESRGKWGMMWFSEFTAELDSWSDKLRVWISRPGKVRTVFNQSMGSTSACIFEAAKGQLKLVRDFAKDNAKAKIPLFTAPFYRQRLYVNPVNGRVYLAEGDWTANGKSFHKLIEIDPLTGRHRALPIPFNAEDMCFDMNGLVYLRTVNVVGRYNSRTWREVPFDYGEERKGVGFGWMGGMKRANLISGLVLPSDANWHHGGMHVSALGHLAVACGFGFSTQVRTSAKYQHRGERYKPTVYPGRLLGGRNGAVSIHVFRKNGKVLYEDIGPGFSDLYGIAIDRHDDVYLMSAATRILNGKPYYDRMTGTLMKLRPKKSRVLTTSNRIPIRLPESQYPDRPRDIVSAMQGSAWVENAEWLYGGVGFGGKNPGNGCACWNARFAFDYLRRSFAPEIDRYSVAVLDSAGNVITRIGTYGNVDDGKPLIAEGGPKGPRSIGNDEVALFHAPYLATHTDHRLFIADPGNSRILSVKLGYYATERVRLHVEKAGGH